MTLELVLYSESTTCITTRGAFLKSLVSQLWSHVLLNSGNNGTWDSATPDLSYTQANYFLEPVFYSESKTYSMIQMIHDSFELVIFNESNA